MMRSNSAAIASCLITLAIACNTSADTIARISTSPENQADLNLGTGWVGGNAPASSDIAQFWEPVPSSTNPIPTSVLGDDLHWLGITVNMNTFNGGTLIGSDGHTLTLGAAGMVVTANRGITFDNHFALSADQTWSNANMSGNKAITVNGDLDLGSHTLTMSGKGGKTFNGVISGNGNLVTSTQPNTERTVTLTGVNTYTGNTTVQRGLFILADGAQLKFVIGPDGVNNQILGDNDGVDGVAQLDGDFFFDLTGAGTTVGDQWTIVDTSSELIATYGLTFSVIGFDELTAGLWSTQANGVVYQFNESDGVLAVLAIPEPGAAALLGVGLTLMTLRPRRRLGFNRRHDHSGQSRRDTPAAA